MALILNDKKWLLNKFNEYISLNSRNRLRQWVSHGARLKWSLLTELDEGREWRPHAPRRAKSKKNKKLE